MSGANFVFMIGHTTRDPVIRQVGSTTVTNFGIAVNRRWKDEATGEDRESVMFIDVEAWVAHGEAVKRYCGKGSLVAVTGRLDLDQWEQDGQKRSRHKITAAPFGVQFLSTRGGEGGRGSDHVDRRNSTSAQGGRGGSLRPPTQSAPTGNRQDARREPETGRQATGGGGGGFDPENDMRGPDGGSPDNLAPLREKFGGMEVGGDIPF